MACVKIELERYVKVDAGVVGVCLVVHHCRCTVSLNVDVTFDVFVVVDVTVVAQAKTVDACHDVVFTKHEQCQSARAQIDVGVDVVALHLDFSVKSDVFNSGIHIGGVVIDYRS